MRRDYTREERLERASRRAAAHIRGVWEETGYSDTRFLDAVLLPDALTIVGITTSTERPLRREHVVPRIYIIEECKRMLHNGATDEAISDLILQNTKIVLISSQEQFRLDSRQHLNLSQKMPHGWAFGDDVFARLREAKIEWIPHVKEGLW
jgi:hypothetical protein